MQKSAAIQIIIFTDLDGTLLDLQNYSFHSALEALTRIKQTKTPLIFCSSKTFTEQQYYQKEMGICTPFIAENGSAIFIPEDYFSFAYDFEQLLSGYRVIELGASSTSIKQELQAARQEINIQFRGYAELSLDELCRVTGLDGEAAARARQRLYSETLIDISRIEAKQLNQALLSVGLSCTWGSRFCTVASSQVDKGKAVKRVINLFQKQFGTVKTVGLGDGANDSALLAAVDYAFLVQKPNQRWESISAPQYKAVEGIGPIAWNWVVCDILDKST